MNYIMSLFATETQFKKQSTAEQILNILLPVSQHLLSSSLTVWSAEMKPNAIELYFLQKAKQNNQHNAIENVF
jgi:hypothetical protein